MEIGAYLFTVLVLWLLGLVFVASLRQRWGIYAAIGFTFPVIALALYLFLPLWLGIYGHTSVRPNPISWHTYIERGGVIGMTLLLVYIIGVFWPIFAAWIVNHLGRHSWPSIASP